MNFTITTANFNHTLNKGPITGGGFGTPILQCTTVVNKNKVNNIK